MRLPQMPPIAGLSRSHRPLLRVAVVLTLPLLFSLFSLLPLSAQTPAQRDSIEAFRDSIAPIKDTVVLRALEAKLIDEAKHDRNDPMRHYRLGFLAIQLGDAGRTDSYDDAAGEFEWATQLVPKEPYGWYGLGLAENAIGDSKISLVAGVQAMFGRDHLTRAALNYAKAAEVDPSFVRGLLELGNTALLQRQNIKLEAALLALRRSAGTEAGKNAQVLLVRGRVERLQGDPDSALVAFRGYQRAPGADSALGLLEVARTLFLLGSLDGQAPYYAAAAIDDSVAVTGIRGDLVDLVGDTALRGLDDAHGKARADWLRDFWGSRDAADLRTPGERVREHYRRLFYARNHFRLVSTKRHYAIEERFRTYNKEYDDRGLIYIRHGEPSERASAQGNGIPPNESWRYARPDGDLIFHFVAHEDVQDYRLVESIFDILGFDTAMAVSNGAAPTSQQLSVADIINGHAMDLPEGVRQAYQGLLGTREHFAPIYSKLLASNLQSQALITSERELGASSIKRGADSDSYTLTFPSDLTGAHLAFLVAGRDGDREVGHLVYAIPGKSLQAIDATQGKIYQIRLRLAVLGDNGLPIANVDSTSLFLSHQALGPSDWLVGRVAVTLPAGHYRYRAAVQNGDAEGVDTPIDTIGVPAAGAFGVSDVILGARSSHLEWVEPSADTVFFNPVGSLRPDVPLEVYYQVFGLAPGEHFKTQLQVVSPHGGGILNPLIKLFGGGGARVSVTLPDVASGPVQEIHRSVGIERLAAGQYVLQLTVTRADGSALVRRATFRVLPRSTAIASP